MNSLFSTEREDKRIGRQLDDKYLGIVEVNSEGYISYTNTLLAFLFGYTT